MYSLEVLKKLHSGLKKNYLLIDVLYFNVSWLDVLSSHLGSSSVFSVKSCCLLGISVVWKIPWMEEPGRLQSMGITKSRTRLRDFPFIFHFHALERKMTTHSSVLPGESQGQRSLLGFRLWGRTESDMTETT